MSRCNEIWQTNNFPPLTGPSFLIGGTNHLLLMGVDPFIVMVQGQWHLMALLEYWQFFEEIIPTFIACTLSSKSSTLSSMKTFNNVLLILFSCWGVCLEMTVHPIILGSANGGVISLGNLACEGRPRTASPHTIIC